MCGGAILQHKPSLRFAFYFDLKMKMGSGLRNVSICGRFKCVTSYILSGLLHSKVVCHLHIPLDGQCTKTNCGVFMLLALESSSVPYENLEKKNFFL